MTYILGKMERAEVIYVFWNGGNNSFKFIFYIYHLSKLNKFDFRTN
jgi:hypothetical protein